MEKEGCTTSLESQCSQLKQSQLFLAPSHCGKALSKPESPPRGLQTDTVDPDCRGLGPGRPTLSLMSLPFSPTPFTVFIKKRHYRVWEENVVWSPADHPESQLQCSPSWVPQFLHPPAGGAGAWTGGSEAAVSRHPWPAKPKRLFHLPAPTTDALFQRDRRKWDPGWHSSSICMFSVLDPSCPI